ncbi:MAG: SpoIIE family protein phosphatase, partial [Leptospiraceae bacterium]|nr:SpoIIE family protein phosphatase [Leptospiraceae bacterium]
MESGIIYVNYYTVGTAIVLCICALITYFATTLPERSRASLHIAFGFGYMGGMGAAYMLSAMIYDPTAAFHRWITVGFVLPAATHCTQIFLHFPNTTRPRLARGLLIGQYIMAILVSGYFMYQTLQVPRIFHFDGDYWDFAADDLSKNVAYVILAYLAVMLGAGIWRMIVTPGRRLALGLILGALLTISVLPSIANALSRDGALDRTLYVILWDVMVVTGGFFLVIVYINFSNERSHFMVKIAGVSLVTLLLVLQGVSYYTLMELEKAYDEVQRQKSARLAGSLNINPEYLPSELAYLAEYRTNPNPASYGLQSDFMYVASEEHRALLSAYRQEVLNALQWYRLANVDPRGGAGDFSRRVERALLSAPYYFEGYRRMLLESARSAAESGDHAGGLSAEAEFIDPRSQLFRLIEDRESTIRYRYHKIRKLPDVEFRAQLTQFLESGTGQNRGFIPFRTAIQDHLLRSDSEEAELKKEVLLFLTPMKAPGTRMFRVADGTAVTESADRLNGERHYVAYLYIDPITNRIYEAGYHYIHYRRFIHPAALKLLMVLLAILLIVLFGFRFFFGRALVNPLRALLSGVREVNNGDFSVQVPVQVEDEIGYLTRSFNGMVRSIRAAQHKLKEYAETLEEKVRDRTAELKKSLDEVQRLKQQQDGDYFLTSLLIKPLGSNLVKSPYVHVDFLVKQKKSFEFRNRHEEIGGDLCMANQITLQGRRYAVFLNADAMGKSMQGAGGALVLGSVFESMITRTQLAEEEHDITPERWLKNAFLELHKTFESFNGSMLVSVVFGLVDEIAGVMYFMNAEHPFTVLYRDHQSRFLEEELMFRKLGTQGLEGNLYVEVVSLRPGDVVVIGSDGRDDLLVGLGPNGERLINEDEQRFLMIVAESNGDLGRMYDLLEASGEFTDDLSLMRIAYDGPGCLTTTVRSG